jgi:type I restriction enzyme, S subunit
LDAVVKWLSREMNDNTGVPTLGKATTERLPLPVSPLAEQRGIVAKIECLMKRCDDLKAKLTLADETAAKLAEAVVSELVA